MVRWSCPATLFTDCGALGGMSNSLGNDFAVFHVEPPTVSTMPQQCFIETEGGLSGTYIPCEPNTYYWINIQMNKGATATHYLTVCTASSTFLGSASATSTDASSTSPNVLWAGVTGEEPSTSGYTYDFADYVIDLNGTYSATACNVTPPGTYTAATCGQSDVNALVNGGIHVAISGDVIDLPAGTCTWTTDVAVTNVGLKLQGIGTPNTGTGTVGAGTMTTTIIDNAGNTNPIFYLSGQTQGLTSTIQNLNILPETTSTSLVAPIWAIGVCNGSGCPQLRVDNVNFGSGATVWTVGGNGTNASSMIVTDNFYGVADHNTLPSGSNVHLFNSYFSGWAGTGLYGDESWVAADTFGASGNFFAENNMFYTSTFPLSDTETPIGGSTTLTGGGRQVVRYNIINASGNLVAGCYGHGTDSFGRPRGMREVECYGNTITVTGGACQSTVGSRSGAGISYGNVMSVAGGNCNQYVNLFAERRSASFSPWGFGAGQGGYDTNDGTTYASGTTTGGNGTTTLTVSGTPWTINEWQDSGEPYSVVDTTSGCSSEIISNTTSALTVISISPGSQVCSSFAPTNGDSYQILRASVIIDQPGHGAGSYISGSTPSPTGSVAQTLDPWYEWNDTTSAGSTTNDFVVNGGDLSLIANRDFYAQSTGIQTNATTPFNGTSGTGWGTLANRPTTCTTGVGYAEYTGGTTFVQFDKCTSTNTWTAAT